MTDRNVLNNALSLYQQGALAGAQTCCEQLLNQHPNNFNARQLLGLIQLKAENFTAAEATLQLAEKQAREQKLAPRFLAQVLSNHALALEQIDQLKEAQTALSEAYRLQPQESAFALNLISLFERANDQSGILELIASAPQLITFEETRAPWLRALRLTGAIQTAIKWAETWLNLSTDEALICEWLALTLPTTQSVSNCLYTLEQKTGITPDTSHLQRWADLLGEGGDNPIALKLYRHLLKLDPQNAVARYLVQAKRGTLEDDIRKDYITAIYNANANNFEQRLVKRLGYHAPQELADQLQAGEYLSTDAPRVADLGCGTGLMAEALKSHWPNSLIDGCDLSLGMLKLARRKHLYHKLKRAEAATWISTQSSLDLITAADVLIYIGELNTLFTASAIALKNSGVLAFTVEAGDNGVELQANGRYRHSEYYLYHLLEQTGFTPEVIDPFDLRKEENRWIKGFMVIAVHHK